MFAVVLPGLIERPSVFGRIMRAIGRPKPRLERVDISCGYYYLLRTDCQADAIDWSNVSRRLGKCAGRLILPPQLTPRQGSGCSVFDSRPYARNLLAEAALAVAREASRSRRVSIGVIDLGCNRADLVSRLMRVCESVRVLTACSEEYCQAADSMLSKMGAAPIISDSAAVLYDCSAVVAVDGIDGVSGLDCGCLLFAPNVRGAVDIIADSIVLPDGMSVPPQIRPIDFAAACYSLLGRSELLHIAYMLGYTDGGSADIHTLAEKIT